MAGEPFAGSVSATRVDCFRCRRALIFFFWLCYRRIMQTESPETNVADPPKTADEIYQDLEAVYSAYDAASFAATFAYCSTSYEHFDGNFDEFQDCKDRDRTSAWERFDAAISRAAENPAVVALIKARGGPLKEALADCTASQRSDLSSPHERRRP